MLCSTNSVELRPQPISGLREVDPSAVSTLDSSLLAKRCVMTHSFLFSILLNISEECNFRTSPFLEAATRSDYDDVTKKIIAIVGTR